MFVSSQPTERRKFEVSIPLSVQLTRAKGIRGERSVGWMAGSIAVAVSIHQRKTTTMINTKTMTMTMMTIVTATGTKVRKRAEEVEAKMERVVRRNSRRLPWWFLLNKANYVLLISTSHLVSGFQ